MSFETWLTYLATVLAFMITPGPIPKLKRVDRQQHKTRSTASERWLRSSRFRLLGFSRLHKLRLRPRLHPWSRSHSGLRTRWPCPSSVVQSGLGRLDLQHSQHWHCYGVVSKAAVDAHAAKEQFSAD